MSTLRLFAKVGIHFSPHIMKWNRKWNRTPTNISTEQWLSCVLLLVSAAIKPWNKNNELLLDWGVNDKNFQR